MHADTAQAVTCRNSVHTQEIMRRLLNSSPLLDWDSSVAPVLSEYMLRMMQHGYPQQYRVDTLRRALRIYDHMVEEDRKVSGHYIDQKRGISQQGEKKNRRKSMSGPQRGDILPKFLSHPLQMGN